MEQNKINCREIYDSIVATIKADIEVLGLRPQLIIYKGFADINPASQKYIELKKKTADECGIDIIVADRPDNDTPYCNDKNAFYPFGTYILQLPAPKEHIMNLYYYDERDADNLDYLRQLEVETDIPDEQSVDEFGMNNYWTPRVSILNSNKRDMYLNLFTPATPRACIYILKKELGDLKGKKVAVVGCRSITTGRFLYNMLLHENVTVSSYHSKSIIKDSEFESYDAVISCVGKHGLIKQKHFGNKRNCICIDVGVSFIDGKAKGDFDMDIRDYQRYTPYVNGVGLLTRACLMENVVNKYYLNDMGHYVPEENSTNSIFSVINNINDDYNF